MNKERLPQPSEGLHGEPMGRPQPLVQRTPTGPGGVPNTQDDAIDLDKLPMEVSQAESAQRNRRYWEPSWGPEAGEGGDQSSREGGQA
jgi:hypothetical protein